MRTSLVCASARGLPASAADVEREREPETIVEPAAALPAGVAAAVGPPFLSAALSPPIGCVAPDCLKGRIQYANKSKWCHLVLIVIIYWAAA